MSKPPEAVPAFVQPTPTGRPGQSTMIEQSRAIAEVQGAIVLAQSRQRSVPQAIAEMRESCGIMEMAESAFFKFPRGGSNITGPSVQLARELGRCWGNIDYGIKELSRDTINGQSEMLAFAWDLQTNVRAETTFIVPHLRDKKGGPERLIDVRDIYEVNANMGARRLREQIFAILPRWFTEQAEAACHETLKNGGGEPFPSRVAKMVEAFSAIKVSKIDIETKLGCAVGEIDPVMLANLTIIYKSIKRGEVAKEEEFSSEAARIAEGKAEQGKKDLGDPFKATKQKSAAPAPDEPAAERLKACKTEQEFQAVLDALDIEVVRQLGVPFLDECRAKFAAADKPAAGKLV